MIPEKTELQTFRKYFIEAAIIFLSVAVVFLFKNYVGYLGNDRTEMIKVIDNNTTVTKENAGLIRELIEEVRADEKK